MKQDYEDFILQPVIKPGWGRAMIVLAVIGVLVMMFLLSGCSSPFAGPDQLDIGIANAAAMQPQHAAEVSRMMAARQGSAPGVAMRLQPLTPLQPISVR